MIVTVATGNAGKLRELGVLLGDAFDLRPPPPGYVPPDEDGADYLANARIKARALHTATGGAVLADDSGIEVDALGGAPGVHSARYAESDEAANVKLMRALAGKPASERTARYRAVLVMILEDGRELVAEGTCEGVIIDTPSGTGGFGYDPIFLFPPFGRTLAEVTLEEKNRVSHRAAAARKLAAEFHRVRPERSAENARGRRSRRGR